MIFSSLFGRFIRLLPSHKSIITIEFLVVFVEISSKKILTVNNDSRMSNKSISINANAHNTI